MDWKLVLQIVGVALGLLYLWLEYRADIRLWAVGLIMPVVHGTLYLHAGLYADASMQGYYILAGLYGWIVWRAVRKKSRTTEPRPERAPKAGDQSRTRPVTAHTAEMKSPAESACAAEAQYRSGKPGAAVTEPCPEEARPPITEPRPEAAPAQPGRGIAHTPLRLVPLLAAAAAATFGLLYLLLVRFTDSTVPGWDGLSTALSMVAMWMLSRKYVEQWLVWLVVDCISVGLYLYKGIPLTAGLYLLYSALAVAGYLRWRRQVARAH